MTVSYRFLPFSAVSVTVFEPFIVRFFTVFARLFSPSVREDFFRIPIGRTAFVGEGLSPPICALKNTTNKWIKW
jgi:hypothetical protein